MATLCTGRPYRHLEISVARLGVVIFWCLDVIETKEKIQFLKDNFFAAIEASIFRRLYFGHFWAKSPIKWPKDGKLITFVKTCWVYWDCPTMLQTFHHSKTKQNRKIRFLFFENVQQKIKKFSKF